MSSELSDIFNQKIKPHYPLGLTPDAKVQTPKPVTNPQPAQAPVEKTEEKPQEQEVKTEEINSGEKSFYERNKNVILAGTAAGAVLLGLRTLNFVRAKNVLSYDYDVLNIINKLSKESKAKFKAFTKGLKNTPDNTEIINDILKEKDSGLKFAVIKHLLNKDYTSKGLINEKNWEAIYDSLVEIKSAQNINESELCKTIDGFLLHMSHKNLSGKTFINKMVSSMKSDKIADNIKLQIANKILHSTRLHKLTKEERINMCKELLSMLKNNSAKEFYEVFGKMGDKFSIGCRLLNEIKWLDYVDSSVITMEERLDFVKYLKKIGKETKIKKGSVFGNSHYFNDLNNYEIRLKCDIFSKNSSKNMSMEDIEKFADEILEDFKNAKENFVEGSSIFDSSARRTMAFNYENEFMLSVHLKIEELKILNMQDAEKLRKIEQKGKEIQDKILEFGKKHFNINPNSKRTNSSSRSRSNSDYNSGGNSWNFAKNKEANAKQGLTDMLSGDKDFEEAVNQIKSGKIDTEFIKKLKRKVAIKYHPDRVGAKTEAEQAQATQRYQDLNGFIEILEKIYNKS